VLLTNLLSLCRFGLKVCPVNTECFCSFEFPIPMFNFCILWDCAPSSEL